jgi:formylglycine-generating enzyme required for sulfatase activity
MANWAGIAPDPFTPDPRVAAAMPDLEIPDDLFSPEEGEANFDGASTSWGTLMGDWYMVSFGMNESLLPVPLGWTTDYPSIILYSKDGDPEELAAGSIQIMLEMDGYDGDTRTSEQFFSELEEPLGDAGSEAILEKRLLGEGRGYYLFSVEMDTGDEIYMLWVASREPIVMRHEGGWFHIFIAMTMKESWQDYYPIVREMVAHWFGLGGDFLGVFLPEVLPASSGAMPAVTPTVVKTLVPPTGAVLGDTWVRPTDGAEMVYVPAGAFTMGSSDQQLDDVVSLCNEYYGECEPEWYANEQPPHAVALEGFWMDRTEVTNSQFVAFLNERGPRSEEWMDWLFISKDCLIEWVDGAYQPKAGYEDHPAVCISWYDANAYSEWVGGRLPTEAEWEYAARGPEGHVFPWGLVFDGTRLNYCDANCANDWRDAKVDDGYTGTAPVGSFASGASWCGALDMAGNVWEWTQSPFADYPSDPVGSGEGTESGWRILRGGSFDRAPPLVRCATRGWNGPDNNAPINGFRVVVPAD